MFHTLLSFFILSACTGEEALGLSNFRVTDQQMSASTFRETLEPERGRLNITRELPLKGAWSADNENDENPHLQVDFWRNFKITKFETQGQNGQYAPHWVTAYKLAYALDGSESMWQTYQESGVDKVESNNLL